MRLDGTLTPLHIRDDEDRHTLAQLSASPPHLPNHRRTATNLGIKAAFANVGAAPDSLAILASNLKMMKNKKRKVTSSTTPSPLHTTIASLPDDVVADILLHLPSAAAILRAAFASLHWIRVALSPTFLCRLRDIHSYPLLLGHFVSPDDLGSTTPRFHQAPLHSSESDGVLAAMVRRGDFFLTRIQVQGSGRHVLEDCSGGLLLFSDTGTLRVFDPMTHRVSSVDQLPRRGRRAPDHRGRTLCLLPNGDDPGAFRVMSLQHGNGKKLRLEVYNSCTRVWRVLPEAGTAKIPARNQMAKIYRGQYSPAMHAGDRIFWKYAAANSLLSLDTVTMTFSNVHLPPGVTHGYAVGETEDGTCCLVHVFEDFRQGNEQMQVWRFKVGDDHEGNGAQMWELERQVPLILDSPIACLSVDKVRAIVGGIVLLCFKKSSCYQHHIAFRLKTLKVEADFMCRGLARPFVIE